MFSYTLIVVASFHLAFTINAAIYYVVPDDHYSTEYNTFSLKHYLSNTSKYFASHSQLLFRPGNYYLNNDIIIRNASHFSFAGSINNGSLSTTITCTSLAGIVVINSSNIIIANIVMKKCNNHMHFDEIYDAFDGDIDFELNPICLLMINCWNITVVYFHSETLDRLVFLNVFGHSLLKDLMSKEMFIFNTGNDSINKIEHNIEINNLIVPRGIHSNYLISIHQLTMANINIVIANTVFVNEKALMMYLSDCGEGIVITMQNCRFNNIHRPRSKTTFGMVFVKVDDCSHNNALNFVNSYFGDNLCSMNEKFLHIELDDSVKTLTESDSLNFTISLLNSIFHNFTVGYVLTVLNSGNFNQLQPLLLVKNTTFSYVSSKFILRIKQVNVLLEGPVKFTCIPRSLIIIYILSEVNITCHKYIEFSNNTVYAAIQAIYVYIKENTTINMYSNTFDFAVTKSFLTNTVIIDNIAYDTEIGLCAFQYVANQGSLDLKFINEIKLNYSILFVQNKAIRLFDARYAISHCKWDSAAAFSTTDPKEVNKKVIEYVNNTEVGLQTRKIFCACNSSHEYDCSHDNLGSFYPGQTASFKFIIFANKSNNTDIVRANIEDGEENIVCKSDNGSNYVNLITNQCTNFEYQLSHKGRRCELIFKIWPNYLPKELLYLTRLINIYTVKMLPCPKGFEFLPLKRHCECDSTLKFLVTHCNINDQTVLRPANSWITATTFNDSHTYHVSSECPFDFCLPYPSRVNLATPDSQCQHNRAGILCGHCQQGFSTVFASSQCKHCSNTYILLTLPIMVSGVSLVILLFLLNLTVTNGNINAFLFYINIISINLSSFFSGHKSIHYTLISFANLDLGIVSCFYNGMTGYDKVWLQLVFPSYLIVIAGVLIMASRYFSTMQRLTAQRALPVLATLFLLTYTKVLLTISSVLFFYSTVTHLPSNYTTLVWPIDTSVALFGVKFTILFTVCLILFLILLLFNITLIFTRTLSRFSYINYFKPLLDSYQGPYKDRFYFWTGLQLLLRAMFFGLSGLDRSTNVLIGSLLLGAVLSLHIILQPHKSGMNNKLEALFLLNLQGIYIANISKRATVITLALVVLAFVQFTCILLHQVTIQLSSPIITPCLEKFGILKYFNKCNSHQPRDIELLDTVPEVTFNYKEFRDNEPLSLGDEH